MESKKPAKKIAEKKSDGSKVVKPRSSAMATNSASKPKKTTYRHSKLASPPEAHTQLPNQEEVAKLAYQYWEERKYQHGFAQEDWMRAVKALSK